MLEGAPAGDRFHEMIRWKGGIVIYLSKLGDVAGLHLSIWGYHATVALSDEADSVFPEWEKVIGYNGAIFVIVPQIKYFSPSISPVEFIAHCNRRMVHPELRKAEAGRLASLDDLPAKNPEHDQAA